MRERDDEREEQEEEQGVLEKEKKREEEEEGSRGEGEEREEKANVVRHYGLGNVGEGYRRVLYNLLVSIVILKSV